MIILVEIREKPKFDFGMHIRFTEGVIQFLEGEAIIDFSEWINRHFQCDFGEVCEEDKQRNLRAVEHNEYGDIVQSSYLIKGTKIWIITHIKYETVVLLPDEY